MLLKQPKFKMLYEDYYVDQALGVAGNGSVSKLFNAQISRPRLLYIIPYFSNSGKANAVRPYQSPVSSAPNTSSLCKLKNLQIQIGGKISLSKPNNITMSFIIIKHYHY